MNIEKVQKQSGNIYSHTSPRILIISLFAVLLLSSLIYITYSFFAVFRTSETPQAKPFKKSDKQFSSGISPDVAGDIKEDEPASDADMSDLQGEIENIEEKLNQSDY